jgi:tyrosinase
LIDLSPSTAITRRRFLTMAAATVAASACPVHFPEAQTTAKYLRRNIASHGFPSKVLASYATAITAMLKLPPSDPRNWYRNAFVHTLDCPHGNWWFPVWHRGYLGWFERTCRELSGDSDFALPFWDWTALPRVPAQFFQGVLDPSNSAYIASYNDFFAQLSNPMSDLWNSFSNAQQQQLSLRGYTSINDVWSAVQGDPMFFPTGQTRALTASNPNLDKPTKKAVALSTITKALAPKDFINFGSDKAPFHSQAAGYGIMEGQPHNNVHNCVAGFMVDMLSPVDPLFFLHHGNIDRLWDVWTRKQQKLNLPYLPTGADLQAWTSEPFLFFHDEKGQEVHQITAGDYDDISLFNYAYEKGSGESVAAKAVPQPGAPQAQTFPGGITSHALSLGSPSLSTVPVPASLLKAAAVAAEGPAVFARITIQTPPSTHGVRFNVYVNPPQDTSTLNADSPSYAGTIEFFGAHHHDEPVAFTVPLSDTLKALSASNALKPDEPLRIVILPDTKPGLAPAAVSANFKSTLADISVGTF